MAFMGFTVIDNENLNRFTRQSGFRNAEFRQLAGLFSRASLRKLIYDMAVDVDMDEGVCQFSYYRTAGSPAWLTFVVRHVGPRTDMYELWMAGRGRIEKSGHFVRTFERLEAEIETLDPRSGRD
jgi:hypothetical protein